VFLQFWGGPRPHELQYAFSIDQLDYPQFVDELSVAFSCSAADRRKKAWYLLDRYQAKVFPRARRSQKTNFNPSCIERAPLAVLKILPVAACPIVVPGLARFTWLGMLNISQRNCRYRRSEI